MQNAVGAVVLGYGFQTTDNSDYSVGMGYLANISQANAVAIGANTTTSTEGGIAIGYGTTVNADNSTSISLNNMAIGYQALASDSLAVAFGANASATANNTFAIGNGATAAQNNSMILGGAVNPLNVGIGTETPNSNASLTLADTDKGFLINSLSSTQLSDLEAKLTAADAGLMTYDNTNGNLQIWTGTVWKSATSINTDNQKVDNFVLNGNSLELSLEGDAEANKTIDLSTYLDNTDEQELSLSTNTLSLSGGSNTIDLSAYLDNSDEQELSLASDVLSISGGATTIDLSTYLDNTDAQDISLSGTALSIDNGSSVDLSVLQDGTGTDSQELSIASNTLSISGGATTIDLSTFLDNTDAQGLSLTGTVLSIENGVGVDLANLDLGEATDNQTLSLTDNSLSIERGNNIDLSNYLDNTDAQTLSATSLTNNSLNLSISNGNEVNIDLSSIAESFQATIDEQNILIAALITRVEALEGQVVGGVLANKNPNAVQSAILYQNIPNPFNNTTSIKYYVSQQHHQAAIVFSDNAGKVIDNVNLINLGDQEIYFNSGSLQSGLYYYTLYVDGVKIDTKKMVIE